MGEDKNGFLIALLVIIANMHGSKAAIYCTQVLLDLCLSVKIINANSGYRGILQKI